MEAQDLTNSSHRSGDVPPASMSHPNVESDDTLDPDIDVAAEQIVNEFATHLQHDAAIYDNDEVMNDPKDEEDEVGVMSHSLAAGGFEELIVAFDEEEEVEEEIEEIIDESYEEEEITEEELLDPNVVEEVEPTEQSMGGGAHVTHHVDGAPVDDSAMPTDEVVHVIPPDAHTSGTTTTEAMHVPDSSPVVDEASTWSYGNQQAIPPEDAASERAPSVSHSEGGAGSVASSRYAEPMVSSMPSTTSSSVELNMELSPTSHQSQKSSFDAAILQASDKELLRGDALLGEMSELSTQSSVATGINKSERSTSALSIKSLKSMLSSKSNKSNTAPSVVSQQSANTPSVQSHQMPPDASSVYSAKSKTSASGNSQRTQTAASVATVPVSNVDAQRYVPGRDPVGTAAGAAPLSVMNEGDVSTSEVMEEYTEEYEEEEIVVEESLPPPPQPQPPMSHQPKSVEPTPVAQVQRIVDPGPPAAMVPPIRAAAAPEPPKDVEMGHPAPKPVETPVPAPAKQESATEAAVPKANTNPASANTEAAAATPEASRRPMYIAAAIFCLVILVVVILSIVLSQGGNDPSRDVPIAPGPGPTGAVPIPPPAGAPVPLVWIESIPAVGGPTESGFASAISLDGNIGAVGAPLYNTTGFGAVFTTLLSDAGTWELLPLLLGEQDGDGFGVAVDVLGELLVVGAPMRPIVDTTTPAGAAYVYSYSPTVGAWELQGTALRSGEGILDANGEFGAAVALGLATFPRAVIGAPKSNPSAEILEAGRVYTFEAAGAQWNALETTPIVGKAASDWFGSSVDMADDGSRFIVGAPGNAMEATGYIQIYEWAGTQWNLRFEDVGTAGEAFGSSVVSLSDSGDLFAAGGPGYSQGSGRVVVYQRQASGDYAPLGQPIVGASGDRIGSKGSLTGGAHTEGTIVVIVTATGSVKSYMLNPADSTWIERFEVLQVDNRVGGVSVKYSEENGLLVGNENSDQVYFYDDQPGAVVSAAPVTTPATTPAATSAPAADATSAPAVDGVAVVPQANATQAPDVVPSTATDPPIAENATTAAPSETWVLTGSSFTPNSDGSAFGTSASLASSTMAVGAPATLQNGAVFLYQNNGGTWETAASGQLFGTEANGLFGSSVDAADDFTIVGAPGMVAAGTTTPAGAALAYSLSNGQWTQIGDVLRGDAGVYGAGEQFGTSVSTANTVRRVVVGAPGSSLDIIAARGRVYVFELNALTSVWTVMLDVPGVAANYALGTSVSMSQDGTQFAMGAPGGGYAELYEYNGAAWVSSYVAQDAAGFGSAVAMLGPYTFAVGYPGANGGLGRVSVFQGSAGVFQQLGPAIDGETGDQLGDTGTISGGSDATAVTIVLGTANGTIKRFDYDPSTSAWIQRGNTVDTGFGSSLNAVAASSQSQSVAVGGPLAAAIYELR